MSANDVFSSDGGENLCGSDGEISLTPSSEHESDIPSHDHQHHQSLKPMQPQQHVPHHLVVDIAAVVEGPTSADHLHFENTDLSSISVETEDKEDIEDDADDDEKVEPPPVTSFEVIYEENEDLDGDDADSVTAVECQDALIDNDPPIVCNSNKKECEKHDDDIVDDKEDQEEGKEEVDEIGEKKNDNGLEYLEDDSYCCSISEEDDFIDDNVHMSTAQRDSDYARLALLSLNIPPPPLKPLRLVAKSTVFADEEEEEDELNYGLENDAPSWTESPLIYPESSTNPITMPLADASCPLSPPDCNLPLPKLPPVSLLGDLALEQSTSAASIACTTSTSLDTPILINKKRKHSMDSAKSLSEKTSSLRSTDGLLRRRRRSSVPCIDSDSVFVNREPISDLRARSSSQAKGRRLSISKCYHGEGEGEIDALDEATRYLEDVIARTSDLCDPSRDSSSQGDCAKDSKRVNSGSDSDIKPGDGESLLCMEVARKQLADAFGQMDFDEIYESSRDLATSCETLASPSASSSSADCDATKTNDGRPGNPPRKPPHRGVVAAPTPIPQPKPPCSHDSFSRQSPIIKACFRKRVCDIDLLLMTGDDVNTLVSRA